jgi:hypothetical protein
LDRVYELPDEKKTPPAYHVQLVGAERLRDGTGIEARTFISDRHPNGFGNQLGLDVNPLALVLTVPPDDGIAQSFREDHPKPKPHRLGRVMPGKAMPCNQLDGLFDAADVARKAKGDESCRAIGVRR